MITILFAGEALIKNKVLPQLAPMIINLLFIVDLLEALFWPFQSAWKSKNLCLFWDSDMGIVVSNVIAYLPLP